MASTQNITLDQGSSLVVTFTFQNADNSAFDLTGYSARAQARFSYPNTPLIDASTSNASVLIDAEGNPVPNSGNGKLTISSPTSGVLVWNIVPGDTPLTMHFDAASPDSIDYLYDLQITSSSGKVYTPVQGTLTINRAVTHA